MSGPPAVVSRARISVKTALAARLERLADSTDAAGLRPCVVVGVSGGADSLALAATTQWVARPMGLGVLAVTIDHGLQKGSAQISERAVAQCERAGISQARILRVDVPAGTGHGGVEQAARVARLTALEEFAADHGALALLLGHTLDDQAEQVLLGLARGAGARSLSGIPRERGLIVRPFLGTGRDESTGLWRDDTLSVCEALGLDAWSDPMNDDSSFLRVAVRNQALPTLAEVLGPHTRDNLVRTADLLLDDADYLDSVARAEYEALERSAPKGALLAFDAYGLAALPRAIRTRVLKRAAHAAETERRSPSAKTLLRRHILQIDALVSAYHGQGPALLPGKIVAERANGLLIFSAGGPRRTSHDAPNREDTLQ